MKSRILNSGCNCMNVKLIIVASKSAKEIEPS